jgi:FHA domain
MSFRLFIYYSAAWGAAAAFFGWILGRVIAVDETLGGTALKGMALGLFVGVGLGLLDALAAGSQRDTASLGVRLILSLLIGALGGLVGGFVGQAIYQWSGGTLPLLLIFGWVLTGMLAGIAPSAFDFLGAVLRQEERRGARRKLRNGLIGGAVGGLAGGSLSLLLHGLWAGVFRDTDVVDLWSPSAMGFVALGTCIGLAVSLAQVILREAWLRVEAGFRPGRQVLLTRPETTIGRAEMCDVGLFGDPGVEKVHARISRQGNRWVLADAGTSSGTLLNGRRITGPTLLHPGDRIQVGGSVLSFAVRAREPAQSPAALPVPISS